MKNKHLFLCYLIFFSLLFLGCSREDDDSQDVQSKVLLKVSIKNKSGFKSVNQLNLSYATLKLYDENGSLLVYKSTAIGGSSATFTLPNGDYKLDELNYYSKSDELQLLLDEDQGGSTISVDNGVANSSQPLVLVEPIKSIWFDWENTLFVNNDPTLPILPWISGASTGVTREVALNHKREDGWLMVHNNFNLNYGNSMPKPKYFLLYNKYTGMLRMWYWHEGANSYTKLKYAIQHTAYSSILNFNGDFAKAMDVRLPGYTEYFSGDSSMPGSLGLVNNTWYMFEYEFAYDDQVANITKEKSDLFLLATGVNITDLKIDGNQNGNINGSIEFNAPGANLFNIGNFNIGNKDESGAGKDQSLTKNSNNPNEWWSQLEGKLTSKVTDAIGNAGAKLASSVLNLVANPIAGYLGSLVHQGLSSSGSVNLKMSTKISLTGTLTSQAPVVTQNLHVPGINAETGLVYLYKEPLGVFNINTKPVVKYQQTYYKNGYPKKYLQFFELDRSSFKYIFNKSIIDSITILETKAELYFYKRYSGYTQLIVNANSNMGPVELGARNELVYETKRVFREPITDNSGDEYYKLAEGAIPPVATTGDLGISWSQSGIAPEYFLYTPKLAPDGRVVVKVVVRFKIKKTGREVTIVKTYLPRFVENQTLQLSY